MSVFAPSYLNSKILRLVIDHVFMPMPMLPRMLPRRQKEQKTNVALCDSLIDADFLQFLPPSEGPLWMQMTKMIKLVRRAAKAPFSEGDLQRVLSDTVSYRTATTKSVITNSPDEGNNGTDYPERQLKHHDVDLVGRGRGRLIGSSVM